MVYSLEVVFVRKDLAGGYPQLMHSMAASFRCRHLHLRQPGKRASISPNSTHFPLFPHAFLPRIKSQWMFDLKNGACTTSSLLLLLQPYEYK